MAAAKPVAEVIEAVFSEVLRVDIPTEPIVLSGEILASPAIAAERSATDETTATETTKVLRWYLV